MARTKRTLKCDPNNPPADLLCGYCGKGHKPRTKKMLENTKKCCVCNKLFPVHAVCAKTFFKFQSAKQEPFDDKTFLKAAFKFYCHACKTSVCAFCDKEHPLGTPYSYIAVCSKKHWFVCTEKCFPSAKCKTTAKTKWFCILHDKKNQGRMEKVSEANKETDPGDDVKPSAIDIKKTLPKPDIKETSSNPSESISPKQGVPVDDKNPSSTIISGNPIDTKETSSNPSASTSTKPSVPVDDKKPSSTIISGKPIDTKETSSNPRASTSTKTSVPVDVKKPSSTIISVNPIDTKKTSSNPSASDDNEEESEHPKLKYYDPEQHVELDHNQLVRKWYKTNRKGSFSMLEKKNWPEALMSKIMTEFENKFLPLSNMYNEESDEAKIQELIVAEKELNKEFLVRCSLEEDNKDMLRQSGLLPYTISAGSIIRLKQEEGLESYLNEELIYLFNVFMQESGLKNTKEVPHIYLPSCYEHILNPCESKYPATKFDHFLDKEWFQDPKNRYKFYQEYSLWFHKEARARLDIVFDCFKAKKMVSFVFCIVVTKRYKNVYFLILWLFIFTRNQKQFQCHTTKVKVIGLL